MVKDIKRKLVKYSLCKSGFTTCYCEYLFTTSNSSIKSREHVLNLLIIKCFLGKYSHISNTLETTTSKLCIRNLSFNLCVLPSGCQCRSINVRLVNITALCRLVSYKSILGCLIDYIIIKLTDRIHLKHLLNKSIRLVIYRVSNGLDNKFCDFIIIILALSANFLCPSINNLRNLIFFCCERSTSIYLFSPIIHCAVLFHKFSNFNLSRHNF